MTLDKSLEAFDTAACRGDGGGQVLAARATVEGTSLTSEQRDQLLEACKAGAHVELYIDILAYEQRDGESNRNYVRFRNGAMTALGRSGVNSVFLADHNQREVSARGGTIVASRTERRGPGDFAVLQTVKLTAPWAVEAALRGLMDRFSIGWSPQGDRLCSICATSIMRCAHWPGEVYEGKTCEIIFQAAELIETSSVNVPAVPGAQIEGIRAALTAAKGGALPRKETHMDDPKLLAMLGLAATASEAEVTKAVESLQERLKLAEQQRDELAARTVEADRKVAEFEAVLAEQGADRFVADAIRDGKVTPGDHADAMRAFYLKDHAAALAMLASMPVVTPVGVARQTAAEPAAPKDRVTELADKNNISPEALKHVLAQLKA